jgi:hypothetical protein
MDFDFDPFVDKTLAPPAYEGKEKTLDELDLSNSLLEQYHLARRLQVASEVDQSIPLNQKVQSSNSLIAIIASIVKLQVDLHNAQNCAKMEQVLINVLKRHPTLQDEFLKDLKDATT